jgi:tetratricopeptide (TPR) repeat protein
MRDGQKRFLKKNYSQAKDAYLKALEHKPRDTHALKSYALVDSIWAKDYVDKGDDAYRAKNYVLAKANYQTALSIKPEYPSLQNKYKQAKNEADPVIYELEKENADQAFKANDFKEARRAYDSALSVRQGDKYIQSRLKLLVIEEQKIEQEERVESVYQEVLASAKQLAEKGSDAQDYELAIKEYQRALTIIPNRKFPKKRINELKKLKKGS